MFSRQASISVERRRAGAAREGVAHRPPGHGMRESRSPFPFAAPLTPPPGASSGGSPSLTRRVSTPPRVESTSASSATPGVPRVTTWKVQALVGSGKPVSRPRVRRGRIGRRKWTRHGSDAWPDRPRSAAAGARRYGAGGCALRMGRSRLAPSGFRGPTGRAHDAPGATDLEGDSRGRLARAAAARATRGDESRHHRARLVRVDPLGRFRAQTFRVEGTETRGGEDIEASADRNDNCTRRLYCSRCRGRCR
jgi:hypothetical protein